MEKKKENLLVRSLDSKRRSKGKKRVFLLAMEIKPLPSTGNVKLQWKVEKGIRKSDSKVKKCDI